MMETSDWIGTATASERLGLAPRTIYRLIDTGELPAFRFGRVIRLRSADIDRFIEASRITATK